MAQRVGMTALRRVAASPSRILLSQNVAKLGLAAPLMATQTRYAATAKVSTSEGEELLAKQRLQRPVSPHLSIYRLDQVWFGSSAWMRITGAAFSGALYVYATAYLAAPLTGWHLESASLAASFATLPVAVKGAVKTFIAWPFVFHTLQGVRHLVMDLGYGYAKQTIIKSGWYLWFASIAVTLGIVAAY